MTRQRSSSGRHHELAHGHRRRSGTGLVVLLALAAAVTLAWRATPAAEAASSAAGVGPAWVRAAHLVPDLPVMDVDLVAADGTVAGTVEGAGYGDISTYSQVRPGSYTVSIRPAGSPTDAAPVLTGTLRAEPGRAYTVAALGTAATGSIVPLDDDLSSPPQGQARVRVLSAASSAPAVDVVAVDGPVVTTAVAFGSSTAYADVPAGPWTLEATSSAGAGAPAEGARTDVTLRAGSTYTLAVTDAGGALRITPVPDAAGAASAPVGGAATGAGGSATAAGSPARGVSPDLLTSSLLGAVVASCGAALVLLLARRRPSRS